MVRTNVRKPWAVTHKSKNCFFCFVDGRLKLNEGKPLGYFSRQACYVSILESYWPGNKWVCGNDVGAWYRCCAPVDWLGGLLSCCECTELRASCLVRLQVKQRTTSTSLHFTPIVMSCDRHSARWGQVTPCLQMHYCVHQWFLCVMLQRVWQLFTNTWW